MLNALLFGSTVPRRILTMKLGLPLLKRTATAKCLAIPMTKRFAAAALSTSTALAAGPNFNDDGDNDKRVRSNPFDSNDKKKWDRSRFGKLNHTSLGNISDCAEMRWPVDHKMSVISCKNHALAYRMVDVETEAERVADIYQRSIDEMVGNSDYIWHHRPEEIREAVKSGRYSIWGTYIEDGTLISVQSAEFMYGQRGVHAIWGAVDPDHRGKGVWEYVGVFMDKMIEKSGAQYGIMWVATTHNLSQRMVEKVGWKPVGCFEGGEWMGGSDGKYYRQNVIWYSKMYGSAATDHVQSPDDMVLTEKAARVASAVLAQK